MEPKLKFFFWLLWRDRIPHKMLLALRNIVPNSCCPRCHLPSENSAHVIRDCVFSMEIWKACGFDPLPLLSFNDWLRTNLEVDFRFKGIEWADIFPYLCHEIWKNRNDCSINGASPSSADVIIPKAISLSLLFIQSKKSIVLPSLAPRNTGSPPSQTTRPTIHVDASFTHLADPMGTGGVARDERGFWIIGFGTRSFAIDVVMAEIMAIQQGLLIARQFRLLEAIIFTDCMNVVGLLYNHESCADKYMSAIFECRKLWRDLPQVTIEYCSRKDNQVADLLAKESRIKDGSCNVTRMFPIPPSYCNTAYIADFKTRSNMTI
ncbi:uncharacterized protein LOC125492921 [Beta vulgaris subsp. vulgaris]|uniref:uncharacterized protein LOC125492921 n=1 Tax=Beta vulgaris subsp. vulgaris TaxID=3555 RepID=UPI0020373E8B|nr:uncharacterized protein LOC125492921 [Beta vulgaris subsp. vulgaris]